MKPEELKTVAIMAGSMGDAYWELSEKTQTLEEVRETIAWQGCTDTGLIARAKAMHAWQQGLIDLLRLLDKTGDRDTRGFDDLTKRIYFHVQRLEGEVEAKAKAARAKTMAAKKAAKATAKG